MVEAIHQIFEVESLVLKVTSDHGADDVIFVSYRNRFVHSARQISSLDLIFCSHPRRHMFEMRQRSRSDSTGHLPSYLLTIDCSRGKILFVLLNLCFPRLPVVSVICPSVSVIYPSSDSSSREVVV